ncbi:MAG: hypothetical protein GY853_16305 [PVC group bacterium]|nr:hypothetical protein [PVC group bacterium]
MKQTKKKAELFKIFILAYNLWRADDATALYRLELNGGDMNKQQIRSGDYCKCEHCGHEGYMYGAITGDGGTAPWCTNCGKNNKLIKLKK